MPDPIDYTPGYSFSGYQANSPATPLPATNLDDELANIAEAIASHLAAIKDVRRSDGGLKNNSVTYDSLSKSLQLTFDPTNGEAVAAAIAVAEAAAAAASGSATAASTSATNAAASAAAAAVSAGSVNLTLFLSKAGNLAGLGNIDTSRANISAMKTDASDATGRLAKTAGYTVTDYNNCIDSGNYASSPGAANAPDAAAYWLVHVIGADTAQHYITQIAYKFGLASIAPGSVISLRRYAYDNAGSIAWTPWISNDPVPVGSVMVFPSTAPPDGYAVLAGSLLSRTTYPALWAYANASGNIVSEASWAASNNGAFSAGDLSTTFRIPDLRGEFIRGFDGGRGADTGRTIGTQQADSLKDHTHTYSSPGNPVGLQGGGTYPSANIGAAGASTGSPSTGAASETRPRNIALLACIKF
jgi:phage-related tail fiber protein